jgi:P4 family phage/plasmid primase-like protien
MTEFTKKAECIEYCKGNNLPFFQRDVNTRFQKIHIADSYESIFSKLSGSDDSNGSYYESWWVGKSVKLFIDYDRKVKEEDDTEGANDSSDSLKRRVQRMGNGETTGLTYKNEILNIINFLKTTLSGITGVLILKSIPDITKKSYHIIFEGIHFPNMANLKLFINEILRPKFKELFDSGIIDPKVYGNTCFRTLLSSKYGQNRPLMLLDTGEFLSELNEIVIPKEQISLETFKRTCITSIDQESTLYNYKPLAKGGGNVKKMFLVNDGDIYSDKEVIKKYLDVLDPDRYNDRNKWLNIGYILYSINPDNWDLWHYFSSKWEYYNEDDANIAWDSFVNCEYIYTIHSLMFLAQVDNREEYDELSKEIPNHDIRFLRPFDNVISKLIYRLYGENFVCSNPEKNEWYYFNGIRWTKENKSYNLRKLMINDVFTRVETYRKLLIKEGASEDLIKNYHNILKILGSGNKLNCLELEFYNSNFYKIIDQNKDLVGFENGVFDLVTGEFRKGTSTDYISMSTGYEYIEYSKNDSLYTEVWDLICKILPIEDVRHFTLKSLASCLDGHVRDENFYIYSGKNNTGGNGKSTLTDLLLKALGEYACVAPVSLVTGKRETSNSANSALANIRNKRAVIMQEPDANEQIQASIMKALTGGDRISTRDLHSTQMEFKPHAKMFMCCNKIPSISEVDGGTLRRLKITEFVARFVDNPTSGVKRGIYEFKIDKDLKAKLDNYKGVFMNILLNYYRIYIKEGLKPPDSVIRVTKKYENDNNIIKQFIDENIVVGTKMHCITKDELKSMYGSDSTLKSNFKKFTNFVTSLETALCAEFVLDQKKKVSKLVGFYLKDDDDYEEVDECGEGGDTETVGCELD